MKAKLEKKINDSGKSEEKNEYAEENITSKCEGVKKKKKKEQNLF